MLVVATCSLRRGGSHSAELLNCFWVEDTSLEPVVFGHEPLEVGTAELSSDWRRLIPHLVFEPASQPAANGRPLNGVDLGTALSWRGHRKIPREVRGPRWTIDALANLGALIFNA